MGRGACIAMFAALVPAGVGAICMDFSLEAELRKAQIVYEGTVVESRVHGELGNFDHIRMKTAVRVVHKVAPQIQFKGNPSEIGEIYSYANYNDPSSKRRSQWAEVWPVHVGMTVLIVGDKGEMVPLPSCTSCREWTIETAKKVRAFFGESKGAAPASPAKG